MQNNNKLRAALLVAVVLCGSGEPSMAADWWVGDGSSTIEITKENADEITGRVYGNRENAAEGVVTGHVTMNGGNVADVYGAYSETDTVSGSTVQLSGGQALLVYGGYSNKGSASGNTVSISDNTVNIVVYGGCSYNEGASGNTVSISGGTVSRNIFGGYSTGLNGEASSNTIILSDEAKVKDARLYGGHGNSMKENTLVLDGWSGTVSGLYNFQGISFENIALNKDTELDVSGAVNNVSGDITLSSLGAGDYGTGEKTVTVSWDEKLGTNVDSTNLSQKSWAEADRGERGVFVNHFSETSVSHEDGGHQASISTTIDTSALTGQFIDENGDAHVNSQYAAALPEDQKDMPQALLIGDGFTTNVDTVAGVYDVSTSGKGATGGQVYISGDTEYAGAVYAGYSENGTASGNTVYVGYDGSAVKAADASGLSVYGATNKENGTNNALHVYGNGNQLGSIGQFNSISFDEVTFNDSTAALSVTSADLTNTDLSLNSLKGGTAYQEGDHVTLIQSANAMEGMDSASVTYSDKVTAGVTQDLQIETEKTANAISMTVKNVSLNPQTTVIAENRTAAAAFLNQGADIAADSLDLLGSDYKYGLRTFGAVYGNRSTYDAAGDMKINGWSEIVGLGNVHRKGAGDLSWGVFYENGTGNYRTWNEFNNEMFRGDGSLLYNGGGAAVRYKRDDGWYYEAGVRAGTLSASMENAVKDGNGNSYGFDSDSTYWGMHAGLGRLIETGRGEWNVYGKYFHTDIDGDSFTIDGDRFAFDSLTSDRLRLGARYTADRAKRWSLYCGLAWEYEFSGDSHMRAGRWDTPEQSLGGSTGIAEIGTVWQPDDSPWQANINLKGYAGERDGFSGMVQLAYTF